MVSVLLLIAKCMGCTVENTVEFVQVRVFVYKSMDEYCKPVLLKTYDKTLANSHFVNSFLKDNTVFNRTI